MLITKKQINSAIVFLYFLFVIVIEELTSNNAALFVFYPVFFLGIYVNFLRGKNYPVRFLIVIMGAAVSCGLGYLVNNNISILSYLYICLGVCISIIIMDKSINNNLLAGMVFLNSGIILALILSKGNAQLFPERSANYVSVYLMMLLCLYYAKADIYEEKILISPAIVTLILSVLAGGRGGFIAALIIFIPVLLRKLFSKIRSKAEKVVLIIFLIVLSVMAGYPLLMKFIHSNSDLDLIRRFSAKALTSNYRVWCWEEYIQSCLKNPIYFLFGSRIEKLQWAKTLAGNLHNSFLIIHSYAGIAGILFILYYNARALKYAYKNKKWIYLFSLLAFEFRGFTDHVFGANRLTPVFLALLMTPDIARLFYRTNISKSINSRSKKFIQNIQLS